jgi:DNA-binding XRE family transcriptional regulator
MAMSRNYDKDLRDIPEMIELSNQCLIGRSKFNLTQDELAKQAYVAPRTVFRLEKCMRLPRMKSLLAIATVLKIDINTWTTLHRDASIKIMGKEVQT